MKFVYLVCSRCATSVNAGLNILPFKKSEICAEIEALRSRPFPYTYNVLQCCSSRKKAIDMRNRFNGIDEYRYSQFLHKNSKGIVTRIVLTVYDYYIVRKVLV